MYGLESMLVYGYRINTRLLVSVPSPECSDCLLKSMEQQQQEKNKCKKTLFFFCMRFFVKIITPYAL